MGEPVEQQSYDCTEKTTPRLQVSCLTVLGLLPGLSRTGVDRRNSAMTSMGTLGATPSTMVWDVGFCLFFTLVEALRVPT